ncbi:MAG: hypothetical protein P1P73_04385 [Brevefilum sp.]|nr:hypothetical protein [Brevefilum sp.]
MAKEPRQFEDDDGRVICDMDVAGMPWYDRQVRREKRTERRAERQSRFYQGSQMTKSEARRYTWYAMLAGLTIALVFSAVLILFTLFSTQIWLR